MSIQKITRKSGVRYRARVRHEHGQQCTKIFTRKIDAEAWEREQLRLRERPELRPSAHATLTLDELVEAWDKHHASTLAAATAQLYRGRIRNYISPTFGSVPVVDITVADIDDWYAAMQDVELSRKSINDTLTLFGGLFRWGMRRYELPRNPCDCIQKLKLDPSGFDFWSEAEAEQFVDRTTGHPYHDAFVMAINTGVRFGEMVGLKWDQVHFGRNQIVIARTWCRVSCTLRNTTKGGKARVLPMNPTVRALLIRRQLASQSEFVLTNADGIRHLPNRLNTDHFAPACEAAEVRTIRFHDLRHTFASHFVMNGGDMYSLQKLLGHADIKTTQRYAHLSPDHLQALAGLVEFGQKEPAKVLPFCAVPTD